MSEDVGIDPRERELEPLDLGALFGNDHPVILEIGSGKGRFLVEHGRERPDHNFLGIEKSLHYYRHIVDRIVRRGIPNVRVINYDAAPVMERLLPPDSIKEIHIYFPDPWPRPRERKRRIIRPEIARAMERILRPDGMGWYVTDHRDYFEAAAPVLAEVFETEAGEIVHDPPRTNYEAKYQREGRPIFQVRFWKASPVGR
ncbi:MAG: tRNA (guanosine(46)-N7)-methyltransferase TrmB [Thermoanaerobaculia bacterium]